VKTISLLRPLLEFGGVVLALIVGLRVITGLFGSKRTTYQLTFGRQLALLFWPLLCLSIGLPFLASFLFAGTLSGYELVLLVALAALVLGFAVPALLLHLQYYVRNHATTVVFEPKQNVLEVYEHGQRLAFERADIVRVEYVRCVSRRLFWSNYEYVQLQLRGGQVLTLTSLLLKLEPLAGFLRNTHLHNRQYWFCIIRS
jgi:ABC-type amino acid transport system permease subunit